MTYENDRDRKARLIKEFWAVKEKACQRCGVVKANSFEFFQKKWFLDRQTFVTVDVCKSCQSAAHRARWIKKHWEDYDYAVFKAEEAVRTARIARGLRGIVDRIEWDPQDHAVYLMSAPSTPPVEPRPK